MSKRKIQTDYTNQKRTKVDTPSDEEETPDDYFHSPVPVIELEKLKLTQIQHGCLMLVKIPPEILNIIIGFLGKRSK